MWQKAQPNIGKTVSYETYQRDVERAEKAPSTRNDILAKGVSLEYQWQGIHISLHTKKLNYIDEDPFGNVFVRWASTYPKGMTSVPSHFYSHLDEMNSELRPDVILPV